jgi:hypothetical protein
MFIQLKLVGVHIHPHQHSEVGQSSSKTFVHYSHRMYTPLVYMIALYVSHDHNTITRFQEAKL